MKKYRNHPIDTTKIPPGIPYIIFNEAAERFSFYGMKGILLVFMTTGLVDNFGQPDSFSESEAKSWFHLFTSLLYGLGFLGAFLSDGIWGKYKTIFYLSIVYCIGHFVLSIGETKFGLFLGLFLICIGSGGIKPSVSAHIGDQFCFRNEHIREKIFGWFYLSINLGAFFSMLLIPLILEKYGSKWAFGIPGISMGLATISFWMGRYKFTHIPPKREEFFKEIQSLKGLKSIITLIPIYIFVSVFWSLYDQTGSSWVIQANKMDLVILGYGLLPSQIQAVNPFFILVLTPVFTYYLYPFVEKFFPFTPLIKIGVGFFFCALSFGICTGIEHELTLGYHPNIIWQILAYIVLTSGEVMVSITCLEFSYEQAGKNMKSLVMALFLFSISAGNLITSVVNVFIQNPDGSTKIKGEEYFMFFTVLMVVTTFIWIPISIWYSKKLMV